MTTLPVTKPYATHSPSLEQRDTVTAEDLAEYRLPPALPLSLAGTNYMGPATPRRPPSPPPSPVHPSPSFRARSLPPSHATTETHENSELDDDDNQDDTMDVEAGASPMESNDPFNKATLSPFADMLRRSGVISLGSEVPINIAFRRLIRGKKRVYYTRITVAETPLEQVDETAGPLCDISSTGTHMASHLGNLRVHVHLLGVQIWCLDVDPSSDIPVWRPVTTPGRNTRHPDTRNLYNHCLSIQNGAGVPSWVTTKTLTTYHSRFAR